MKLVFMGTPEFAVPSLEKLADEHELVAVITAPDKPAGRGKHLRESAVKQAAKRRGIAVMQPPNLKDPDFQSNLANLDAELFVVVAFRMLPDAIWSMPPKGTINLHASLLPQYRGAAPINRAVMNGESKTGLTTFFIQREIDTGAIISQKEMDIGPDETAGSLHDRMMDAGADLLNTTVRAIAAGTAEGRPQEFSDERVIKSAPKIFKADCRIDWDQSAEAIHNHIRGLSPYPAAWTSMADESGEMKILLSRRTSELSGDKPGNISVQKDRLFVHTATDLIEILELQAPGKKRMKTGDFLRGLRNEEQFKFM